ncbi:MAG: undecaprenyldiphospho-muramoylpentapeptide beta-N-acetylglucosaminyltransferase [Anaerolineae bacterium]
MPKKNKIIIAAGGTGGHLFPAQTFAEEVLQKNSNCQLLFAGHGLTTNRYFAKERFDFKEVLSSSPFQKGRKEIWKNSWQLVRGIKESMKVLSDFDPDLVVGFGSFHAFPLLAAAVLRNTSFVLFESNVMPGKVTRLLSRWARITAVQFPQAARYLRGSVAKVSMPIRYHNTDFLSVKEARNYFYLDPDIFTFLVFGGSQGAVSINEKFCKAAAQLKKRGIVFQVIHLTGKQTDVDNVKKEYEKLGISSCVKDFESNMGYAWKAASFAICRAGASTIAEEIAFEVPAILIPYPHASDDHQTKNAQVMANEIKGALYILESQLEEDLLFKKMSEIIEDSRSLQVMRQSLKEFKNENQTQDFFSLIDKL